MLRRAHLDSYVDVQANPKTWDHVDCMRRHHWTRQIHVFRLMLENSDIDISASTQMHVSQYKHQLEFAFHISCFIRLHSHFHIWFWLFISSSSNTTPRWTR